MMNNALARTTIKFLTGGLLGVLIGIVTFNLLLYRLGQPGELDNLAGYAAGAVANFGTQYFLRNFKEV